MNIVIVGKKGGRHHIRWAAVIALAVILALVLGGGSGFVYFLLSGQWNHMVVAIGLVTGIAIVGLGVINGLRTPLDKLQSLE
jgi:hypothetical protein